MNFFLKFFKLLPPEFAHQLSLSSLNLLYTLKILKLIRIKNIKSTSFIFEGLKFDNKLGTAAGLDKNGDYIDSLGELGFGFLEVGTVTPIPQKGNKKPRIFRLNEDNSIINSLGFNNKGVDYLVKNLKKRKFNGVVGVNVGANKTSKGRKRITDFLVCINKVHPYSDYITINISSPNTPNLREFHNHDYLKDLINSIENEVKNNDIKTPLFLKISPDEENESLDIIIELINNSIFRGIIATNTTTDKSNISNDKFKNLDGGLSGKPLMLKSTNKLSYIKSKSIDMPLIGVGGVMTRKDYQDKLNAGASLVQVYTGFIINGPKLLNEILNE